MLTTVFLSSTAKDLAPYRDAVNKAIQRRDGYHCVRMEDFGARSQRPEDFCRKAVGESDIFVCILGLLYGSQPEGSEQSFTEIEYEAAALYSKPRLVFMVPDDFPIPGNLLEVENDERRRRQQAFRDRARKHCISETFATPDELALDVISALDNWERDQQREQERRQSEPPNASLLPPYTCDRVHQEADFKRAFPPPARRRHGFTHFFLVPGEERESHESLVRRFQFTRIQQYAESRRGAQNAAVILREVGWPAGGPPEEQRDLIRANLFEALDPGAPFRENFVQTAPALRALLARLEYTAVVLTHRIPTRAWDKATPGLLSGYFDFWDEVMQGAAGERLPQVLAFFNVVYPATSRRGRLTYWFARAFRTLARRPVRRTLRELAAAPERAPDRDHPAGLCVLLDELSCVTEDDVMKWLRDTGVGEHDRAREALCRRVLTDEAGRPTKCANMRDVEANLLNIHTERLKV